MKTNTLNLLLLIAALVLVLSPMAFSQYQPIWDDTLYTYVGVRIDKGPEHLHADLSTVDIPIAGKYVIWANMVHDSGDEQLNESYYITAVHEDGTEVTPLDPNAGPYKVIADYPGMTSDPVFENTGRFNLKQGRYTIKLHHYITIHQEYPEFRNGKMGGDTGEAESLYIQDSLFVWADPDVDGQMNVDAWTKHTEIVNSRLEKTAHTGETVNIRFKAVNYYINDIRFAKMLGSLPDSLLDPVFSINPNDTINNQFVWDVPRLTPNDTFSVWVSGQVPDSLQMDLLFQNIPGRLAVNSDFDTTNNIDGDHYWARPAPPDISDMTIAIDANPDSIFINGQDTLKLARRGEIVPFTVTINNLLPDTAKNVRVVTELPPDITYLNSSLTPSQILGKQLEWDMATFPPGGQQSWVIQTRLNANTADTVTSLVTPATVYASNDTNTTNNEDAETLLVYEKVYHSDLGVTLTAVTDSTILFNNEYSQAVVAGDHYNLRIEVTNTGADTAYNAKLSALLPDSITISQFSLLPTGSSGDTLLWDLPALPRNNVFAINMTAQTRPYFVQDPFPLQHMTWIEAASDDNPANNQDSERVFAINPEVRVDLAMNIDINSDTSIVLNNITQKAVVAGNAYMLNLIVNNAGPAAANNPVAWTIPPDSVTIVAYSQEPSSTVGDTLFWQLSSIAAGSSSTITMTVNTVSTYPVELFRLNHNATVTSDQPDANPANNSDSDFLYAIKSLQPVVVDMGISVRTLSDTSITVESVTYDAVNGGETYRYFMDITNTGTDIANSATVSTVIPDSVTVVGYSMLPSSSNGQVRSWQLNFFAPDSTLTIELDVQSKRDLPAYPYKVSHTAQVTTLLDVNTANNNDQTDVYILEPTDTTRVDIWADILSITDNTASVNGKVYNAVYPGDTLDYVIRTGNLGPDAALNVSLALTVPEYITLFGYTMDPQSTSGTVNWQFPQVDSDQQMQIHFRAAMDDTVSAQSWIPTAVTTWLAQRDVNLNNNSDTDSVRVAPRPSSFDAEIVFTAQADSQYVFDGVTYPAVIAGNNYTYQIMVTNNGPRTGYNLQINAAIPDVITPTDFSIAGEEEDNLLWNLTELPSGASWSVTFTAQSQELLTNYPYPVISSATLSAAGDTLANNNNSGNTVFLLEPPEVEFIDVTPILSAETDSNGTVDGETFAFARESELYNYRLLVKNIGNRDATNVTITAVYPEAVTLQQVFESALGHTIASDSITWTTSLLPADGEVELGFSVQVPRFMPIGLNNLLCHATVYADNETRGYGDNNRDDLTVKNFVAEPAPFVPEIVVLPNAIDVTDSAMFRVRVPATITKWDIQIVTPSGDVITDFADSYIENNLLQPGLWYDIDDWYSQPYLYSGSLQDDLIIEIHAWNERGTEGIGQAPLIIRSANHMVLDRNVFKPEFEDYVDIRFKLSYERLARLDVFDVSGRLITTLTEDIYNGGWNSYFWNGRLSDGRSAGAGVYLITLDAGDFKDWKKLIIVR